MKKNLITSILSLIFALFLTTTAFYAWITESKSSSSRDNLATTTLGIKDEKLNRYIAVENGSGYSIGPSLESNAGQAIYKPYDQHIAYSKIIYEFEFYTTFPSISISMKNTDENRIARHQSVEEKDTLKYYNYLSNVAVFFGLTTSSSIFSVNSIERYKIPYVGDTKASIINVDIKRIPTTPNQINRFYLLMDYDADSINRLSTTNLGFDDKCNFFEDIMFILKEG